MSFTPDPKCPDDNRYRSRKFILAVAVLVFASAVTGIIGVYNLPQGAILMPLLWWWAGVSSSVLTLYGGGNILAQQIESKK